MVVNILDIHNSPFQRPGNPCNPKIHAFNNRLGIRGPICVRNVCGRFIAMYTFHVYESRNMFISEPTQNRKVGQILLGRLSGRIAMHSFIDDSRQTPSARWKCRFCPWKIAGRRGNQIEVILLFPGHKAWYKAAVYSSVFIVSTSAFRNFLLPKRPILNAILSWTSGCLHCSPLGRILNAIHNCGPNISCHRTYCILSAKGKRGCCYVIA